MNRFSSRLSRGFTLVELLVVIGIIAVLVGILLPVLGSARDTASAVACQSGMRQIALGLLGYAADNKGQFPPGFAWNNAVSSAGSQIALPAAGGGGITNSPAQFWQTILHARMFPSTVEQSLSPSVRSNPRAAGVFVYPAGTDLGTLRLNKIFDCPSVDTDTFQIRGTYQGNPTVMPNIPMEYWSSASGQRYMSPWVGGPSSLIGNSRALSSTTGGLAVGSLSVSDVYSDTALLWETTAVFISGNQAPPGAYYIAHLPAHAWTQIDGGRLVHGGRPDFRYRYTNLAVGSQSIVNLNDINKPIYIVADSVLSAAVGSKASMNSDIAGLSAFTDQIGGPRFRHSKNRVGNVAFADGSVRGLRISPNKIAYEVNGVGSADSEFQRKFLLTKPQRLPRNVPAPTPFGQ